MALGQQPQPQILDDVGVLVFVDQQIAPAPLVVGEDFRPLAEQSQAFEQQIAEIDGVERLEPLLIEAVERRAAAVGEARRLVDRRVLAEQTEQALRLRDRRRHRARIERAGHLVRD